MYAQWRNTRDLLKTNNEEPTDGHFPDATQMIPESLKSPSDDEDVSNTDENEEQG